MKISPHTLSVLLILAFASCKQSDTDKGQKEEDLYDDPNSIEIENIESPSDEELQEYGIIENIESPSDDELQEYGIIENIEDGSYPFFIVTVNFPKNEMKIDFNLNIEAITLNHEDLIDLKGKYAKINYTSEVENSLIDLQVNGTSLLGEYAPEYDSDWRQITGVLSGAAEITPGDLPSLISVTDENGVKLDFEWYVDSEIVKENGKVIDAFYYMRGVNTITNIVPEG